MQWRQEQKDYALALLNDVIQPTDSEDKALEMTLPFLLALADDPQVPPQVREAASKAHAAQDALIAARRQATCALEELEEAAFHNGPPLGRSVTRKPKRFYRPGELSPPRIQPGAAR